MLMWTSSIRVSEGAHQETRSPDEAEGQFGFSEPEQFQAGDRLSQPKHQDWSKEITSDNTVFWMGDLWQSIETAPPDRDIELAVIEAGETHKLAGFARRTAAGWNNTATGKIIDIRPTHWRNWHN